MRSPRRMLRPDLPPCRWLRGRDVARKAHDPGNGVCVNFESLDKKLMMRFGYTSLYSNGLVLCLVNSSYLHLHGSLLFFGGISGSFRVTRDDSDIKFQNSPKGFRPGSAEIITKRCLPLRLGGLWSLVKKNLGSKRHLQNHPHNSNSRQFLGSFHNDG